MEFPAEYMFKEVPNHLEEEQDPIAVALGEMDRHGIAMGLAAVFTAVVAPILVPMLR